MWFIGMFWILVLFSFALCTVQHSSKKEQISLQLFARKQFQERKRHLRSLVKTLMYPGDVLLPGDILASNAHCEKVCYQTKPYPRVYKTVCETRCPDYYLRQQEDGNLCMRRGLNGQGVWCSGNTSLPAFTILEDDLKLVQYHGTPANPGGVIWESNTSINEHEVKTTMERNYGRLVLSLDEQGNFRRGISFEDETQQQNFARETANPALEGPWNGPWIFYFPKQN